MIPLSELLPQEPPMVLLSGYEPQSDENVASSFVDVTPESPFYDPSLGGVPACVALEYMAQTMALLVGLTHRKKGIPPKIGFVLGSRKLEIAVPVFTKGARYRVKAACTYEDESFGSFDCAIVDADDRVCAQGILTAFQVDDGFSAQLFQRD